MTQQNNNLLFVYGTLKTDEPNYDLIPVLTEGKATFLGEARTVENWPLVIASRYNIPYLLYCKGTGMQIIGEVYQVNDTMLAKFDEFECHPHYYTRFQEEVQLLSDNEVLRPWIYFLVRYRPELLELPFMSTYSSKGSHGLEYVTSEKTCKPEDMY